MHKTLLLSTIIFIVLVNVYSIPTNYQASENLEENDISNFHLPPKTDQTPKFMHKYDHIFAKIKPNQQKINQPIPTFTNNEKMKQELSTDFKNKYNHIFIKIKKQLHKPTSTAATNIENQNTPKKKTQQLTNSFKNKYSHIYKRLKAKHQLVSSTTVANIEETTLQPKISSRIFVENSYKMANYIEDNKIPENFFNTNEEEFEEMPNEIFMESLQIVPSFNQPQIQLDDIVKCSLIGGCVL